MRTRLAGAAGFEPANGGTKNRFLALYLSSFISHVGIERGSCPAGQELWD
jgi:hypothetical protein